MIFNGIVPKPWTEVGTAIVTDVYGNQLTLPTTSALSFVFSVMNMIKTVVALNIARIHVKVQNLQFRKILTGKY